MYVTMCPDLGCRVYKINGAEFDPRDATWVPRNTLGEYSLFIGGQLPHCEADATFRARHGRPAVHEAWLCPQCAPPDERHAGTRYP